MAAEQSLFTDKRTLLLNRRGVLDARLALAATDPDTTPVSVDELRQAIRDIDQELTLVPLPANRWAHADDEDF